MFIRSPATLPHVGTNRSQRLERVQTREVLAAVDFFLEGIWMSERAGRSGHQHVPRSSEQRDAAAQPERRLANVGRL